MSQATFISDATIAALSSPHLLGKLSKTGLRRLISDGNINLALGDHKIGDLIVLAWRGPQKLIQCL